MLGLEWRQEKSKESHWNKYSRYYDHVFNKPLDPNFNTVYMFGASMIPNLVFQHPHINNNPRRPDFFMWARFFDGIDNWLIQEMDTKEVSEELVVEAYLKNVCGLFLGYDFLPTDNEFGANNERMREMEFKNVPGTVDRSRRYNLPYWDVIHADKLIVAPGTRSVKNCRWFGIAHILPVRVVKEFPNINVSACVPTMMPKEIQAHQGNDWIGREDEGYISFYQVHSAETGKVFWITSKGKYLVSPVEDDLQVDGLPLEILNFNKGSDSIWGTPDVSYIETQFLEGNECRVDGRKQRKEALVKAFYDQNLISEEDYEKFVVTSPMGGVPVNLGPEKSLSDAILLVQPHVQREYIEYQKELMNDQQLLLGTGPNQVGQYSPGRRTRFEAQMVEEAHILRTGKRRQKLADMIGKHIERANTLITQRWTGKVVMKVIGIEGAMHWVMARPDEFVEVSANLVSAVNVESLAPTNRERRRQEMMEVLNILSKFPGMEQQVMGILNNFLSTFEWAQLQQNLPQANQQQPTPFGEFQQQQRGAMNDPRTMQQLQTNLQGGLNGVVNALPAGQPQHRSQSNARK